MVMVLKKQGNWYDCLDIYSINKLMVKDKFPILVIDDLLRKLHNAQLFTK